LRAQLAAQQQSQVQEVARLEAALRAANEEHSSTRSLAADAESQNAARMREQQEQLDDQRSALALAHAAVQKRLAELEEATASVSAQKAALSSELKAQEAARETLAAEMESLRSSQSVALAQAHADAQVLWRAEREKLEDLFRADCEAQRQKLALEHHFFVTAERAAFKTASAGLDRDRKIFEEAKRAYIDQHPALQRTLTNSPSAAAGRGTSEGGGFGRQASMHRSQQPSNSNSPSSHVRSAASLALQQQQQEQQAQQAHQTATAASLASLQAAIGSGFAALHPVDSDDHDVTPIPPPVAVPAAPTTRSRRSSTSTTAARLSNGAPAVPSPRTRPAINVLTSPSSTSKLTSLESTQE
jgi:hypothetical protein